MEHASPAGRVPNANAVLLRKPLKEMNALMKEPIPRIQNCKTNSVKSRRINEFSQTTPRIDCALRAGKTFVATLKPIAQARLVANRSLFGRSDRRCPVYLFLDVG